MRIVSSYRDIANPEAIHFPGSFGARTRLLIAGALCLATLGAIVAFGDGWMRWMQAAMVFGVLAAITAAWPKRIYVDQYGVHQVNLLGRKSKFIPYSELRPVTTKKELPALAGMAPAALAKSDVIIQSASSGTRITHTPRHSDRARFLKEIERRGARTEAVS